jgi:medium-chain acyl-[acyl-carrier-protein] hydrolase
LVPEIWEDEFRVRSYNCDPAGRASLPALYAFLLESAGAHATAGGFGFMDMWSRGLIWVLTRFKLVIDRYPAWNDRIVAQTWAKGRDGLFHIRDYYLKDASGDLLARATSSWAVLSAATHRPETGDIFIQGFPQRPRENALSEKIGKLPALAAPELVSQYRVRWSDLDFNRHVNSMRYVEWIMNGLDEETRLGRTFKSMEINYLAETALGDEVEIRVQKLGGSPLIVLASIVSKSNGKDAARARFEVE